MYKKSYKNFFFLNFIEAIFVTLPVILYHRNIFPLTFLLLSLIIQLTFFLSLIDPLPLTMILQPVSCSSCFAVMPRGPNILPTKLNCKKRINKILLIFYDI